MCLPVSVPPCLLKDSFRNAPQPWAVGCWEERPSRSLWVQGVQNQPNPSPQAKWPGDWDRHFRIGAGASFKPKSGGNKLEDIIRRDAPCDHLKPAPVGHQVGQGMVDILDVGLA